MLKIIFLATSFVVYAVGIDYCDNSIVGCKATPHIGCPFVNDFDFNSAKCKKWSNIKLADFSRKDKATIVDEHNLARQRTARGEKVPGVFGSRLCRMTYDEDLEETAKQNVLKCWDDHDVCRNTADFFTAGQNLYNSYTTNPNGVPSNQEVFEKGIRKWEAEYEYVSCGTEFDALTQKYTKYGHYSQMMKENACRVGCALVFYEQDKKYKLYFVCNYSAGNLLGAPIFTRGATASGCKKADKEYPGLCSLREDYEVPTMSRSLQKAMKGDQNKDDKKSNGNREESKSFHFDSPSNGGHHESKSSFFETITGDENPSDHKSVHTKTVVKNGDGGHHESKSSFFETVSGDDNPSEKKSSHTKTVVTNGDGGKGKTYTITKYVEYFFS